MPTPTRSPDSRPQTNSVLVALAWVIPGVVLALLAPWMAVHASALDGLIRWLAPLITAFLIGWNLYEGIRVIGRTGRTLAAWPMTAVQLVLFTLLFFQIACHLGAEHFEFSRQPRWYDWLAFVGAHALRAGDMIDFVEAYGLNMQTIHHHSRLVAVCLMGLHLILDLFLLRLLLEVIGRVKESLFADVPREAKLSAATAAVVFFAAVWLISALWVRPWKFSDMILWLADNLIRVVDFFDAMELFHIRLHDVPKSMWENTLTFICRLIFAVGLSELVSRASHWVSLSVLGGFGMSEADLETASNDGQLSDDLRQVADERLQVVQRYADVPYETPSFALTMGGGVMVALLVVLVAWPNWRVRALALAATAEDTNSRHREAAHAALERMGACGEAAAAPLTEAARLARDDERLRLLRTLSCLGPAGQRSLADLMRTAEPELALAAVEALSRRGAAAAPMLVQGFESPHVAVRQAARAALQSQGREALRPLIDQASPEDARACIELFEEIDPDYWHMLPSKNPHMVELRRLHAPLRVLKRQDPSSDQLRAAANTLRDLGPLAGASATLLIPRLEHPDAAVRTALRAIVAADVSMVSELTELLGPKLPGELRIVAAQRLGEIGPPARTAVPRLVALLAAPGHETFRAAIRRIGAPPRDALGSLVPLLSSPAAEVRQTALTMLDGGERNWRQLPVVPNAVSLMAQQLSHGEIAARLGAAWALGTIGAAAKPAIPELLAVVVDQQRLDTIDAAFNALELVDPKWPHDSKVRESVERLIQLIGRNPGNAPLLRVAAKVFPVAFPSASVLVRMLRENKVAENQAPLVEALLTLGPAASEAIPDLIRMVDTGVAALPDHVKWSDFKNHDSNHRLSHLAVKALDGIDPNWIKHPWVDGVVKSLVFEIYGDDEPYSALASELVIRLAPLQKSVAPELVRSTVRFPNKEPGMRVLRRLTGVAAEAIPELALMSVRVTKFGLSFAVAADVLARYHPNWKKSPQAAAAAVRIAQKLELEVVCEQEQLGVCALLREIMPGAKEAVPYLVTGLVNGVIATMSVSMGAPGFTKEDIEKYEEGLGKQLYVYFAAIDLYEHLLSLADPNWRTTKSAADNLDTFKEKLKSYRFISAEGGAIGFYALRIFGPMAKEVAVPLIERTLVESAGRFDVVAAVIARIGLEGKTAAPLLIRMLRNAPADSSLALQVAKALGEVGPATRDVVPLLAQLTSYVTTANRPTIPVTDVRAAAARSLGKIGAPAKPALPALRLALKDPNNQVQNAAREAIDSISKPK